MTKLMLPTILTAAALTLAGCASYNPAQTNADSGLYQGKPTRSRALNVAVATGLTECRNGTCKPLRDVPRSRLPQSLQGKSNAHIIENLSKAWEIGYGAGQIGGAVSVLTGLSNWTSGLLNIADALTSPTVMKDPALTPTVIAWMPASMGDNPLQARNQLIQLFYSALPREPLEGYMVKTTEHKRSGRLWAYFNDSENCNTEKSCFLYLHIDKPALVKKQPSWLGSGDSYSWLNWRRGQKSTGSFYNVLVSFTHYDSSQRKNLTWPHDLNILGYLEKFSANLPKWVYIYLPPAKARNYPVMLNQGKPLLFIQPL